jgi:hypothetical protein
MSDELPPLDAADDEERQSAAALARALEGGPTEPGLPEAALEAAALLRSSASGGQLSPQRSDEIRKALLADLPPAQARPRSSLARWLWLVLPLGGAAAAALLLMVQSLEAPDAEGPSFAEQRATAPGSAWQLAEREPEEPAPTPSAAPAITALTGPSPTASSIEPATRGQSLAARAAKGSASRVVVGLDRDARALRSTLLERLADPLLGRVHAERDAATGRAALEQSRRAMLNALGTLEPGLSGADERLVRQDLYCRLAETALELGEPQSALEWTRRGLDLDGPPTPFLAQLSALEGDALAALGDDESAAKSYLKALQVHESLLHESLDGR